jgi:hypothetical protein
MNRFARAILIVTTVALPLAGCESVNNFDPTEWFAGDIFGNKKKLPGERKQVFPEGVPGLARGVPSELMRDQPPGSDIAQELQPPAPRAAVEEQPKQKARPKAKAAPRPENAAAPSTPTSVTVRRSDSPSSSPFPDPPPTGQQQPPPAAAPWPGEARGQGGGVQWPDPPPPSRPTR